MTEAIREKIHLARLNGAHWPAALIIFTFYLVHCIVLSYLAAFTQSIEVNWAVYFATYVVGLSASVMLAFALRRLIERSIFSWFEAR
jgi:hypothetical protein